MGGRIITGSINCSDIIVNKDLITEYSNSNTAITEGTKELEVSVNRREYNIVGDELYIPKRYEDAPQWLRDIIDTVTSVALSNALSDVNTLGDMLDGLIAELNVAKNTYTMSIISDNDINERINTAIETLNSSLADADSTILDIAMTRVTPEEAQTIALGILSASINGGDIAAAVQNLQSAIADVDSARALDYTRLTAQIGDGLENESTARATAVQYLNTYVGIDTDGVPTGLGTLDTILGNIQDQVDGSISTWFYADEPTLTNLPASEWTTTETKNIHLGDIYYDRLTGFAYRFAFEDIDDTPDEGVIYTWIRITDSDVTKALAEAAQAQETADGKITTFYQSTQPTAEGIGDIWIDSDAGNKMYRWNGTTWGSDLVGTMVANAEAVTALEADLNDTNIVVGGHTTQLSTVDTRIAGGVSSVQTKWAYDSIVNINGVYKKSGFGLTTNYTSGNGTESSPYVSEFWIDASRLKFTNSAMTGRTAPFTIDATGTTPQITFNGKVTFSNISDSATYIPTISSVTAAQTTADTAIANVIKGTNLIYEDWNIGSGSTTVYSQNGTSAENYRVYGNNHLGQRVVLWECRPDANNDGDGGWDTTWFVVDKTKAYRFSVFVKTSANTGTTYLGCGASTVCTLNTTTVDTNPYFWAGDLPSQNEWYLIVGYVYPTGNTGMVSSGGIYNCSTGNKVVSIADFNWTSTATSSYHRCYHYYNTTTTTRQYMWNPRVDKIDGNEPSIIDLIGNFTKVEDIAWQSEVQAAINNNATTIDGGKIVTNTALVNNLNAVGGIVAEYINATEFNGMTFNGGIFNGARINGAVIKASYLDLDGELEVLTNYHISVATRNSNPSLYSDAVYISADNEYRIPSWSTIKEASKSVALHSVGATSYSLNRSYNIANVGNNNKCVQLAPTLNYVGTVLTITVNTAVRSTSSGDFSISHHSYETSLYFFGSFVGRFKVVTNIYNSFDNGVSSSGVSSQFYMNGAAVSSFSTSIRGVAFSASFTQSTSQGGTSTLNININSSSVNVGNYTSGHILQATTNTLATKSGTSDSSTLSSSSYFKTSSGFTINNMI